MELKLKKQRDQKEHSRETNKAPRSVLKHKKGEIIVTNNQSTNSTFVIVVIFARFYSHTLQIKTSLKVVFLSSENYQNKNVQTALVICGPESRGRL